MIAYRHNYAALQFTPKPKKAPRRRKPRPQLAPPMGSATPVTTADLERISLVLSNAGVTESRFGRKVNRDPRFVHDLYAGRKIKPHTRERMEAVLATLGREV